MTYRKAIRFVIRDGAGRYTRPFDHVFTAMSEYRDPQVDGFTLRR